MWGRRWRTWADILNPGGRSRISFCVGVEAMGMSESFKGMVENVKVAQRALKDQEEEEMDSPEEWGGSV